MALITTPIDAVQWHTQPLTSQTVNAELWTPGHSATLSTPARRQVPFKCPPAPQGPHKVEISSRDRANPGTGVGRHPTSEEHLDSPRGPGVGRSRAGSPSPSPCDTPAASSSWPTPSLARPTRRYVNTAGGAGLPQPPHAALRRGMQTGFDSPEQLHNSIHIAKGRGRKFV